MLNNWGLSSLGLSPITRVLTEDEVISLFRQYVPNAAVDKITKLVQLIYSKYRVVEGGAGSGLRTQFEADLGGASGWVVQAFGYWDAYSLKDDFKSLGDALSGRFSIVLPSDANVTEGASGQTGSTGPLQMPAFTPQKPKTNPIVDFVNTMGSELTKAEKQRTADRLKQLQTQFNARRAMTTQDANLIRNYNQFTSNQRQGGSNFPIVIGVIAVIGVGAAIWFARR